MALSIRTNYSSLNAQRNLSASQADVDNSMRKLSSGYRITRAADDAAGLAISEKLGAKVAGTNQAIRNANDGISLIQTAEGGLAEIGNIVQRMRELAVQGSTGTLVIADHDAIMKEMSGKGFLDRMKSMQNLSQQGLFNPGAQLMKQKGTTGKRLTTEEKNRMRKQREKELRKRKRDTR